MQKGKYTMKGLNSLCLSLKIIKPGRISAKSLVLNQLQTWIIEGVLKPNEKINDGELAEALGVSRTPVREALQILELSGLVEMVPGQKRKLLLLS